tara:strand:- start:32321 stop:34834 length:2514 start_codon:yes stop_codon:yes gene_type:complete
MNVSTKPNAVFLLSLTSLILVCFSVSDTQAHAQTPSKCSCLQTLTAASDSAELCFYHTAVSLSTTDPETQSNWLRLETLTGGHWVELDLSQPMINTNSQPLRISYVHTDPKQQKLEASLVLKQFLTKATLDSDAPTGEAAQSAGFKLKADAIPKSSYKLKNLNTVVFPRLTPGVYSLKLHIWKKKKEGNKEQWKTGKPQIHWLNIAPTPPEPPQLVSINQRLAERGKLTLKFKNVVVGDHIRFYVDGEQGPGVTISKESQLEQYFPLGSILPPGKSKVTAQLKRGDQLSSDSSPVSVNSRATVFITRQIDVNEKDFDDLTSEELEKERQNSPRAFVFLEKEPQKKTETNQEVSENDSKLKTVIKCLQFQNSGWDVEPIYVWPDKADINVLHQELEPKTPMHDVGMKGFPEKVSDMIVEKINKSQEFTLDISFKPMNPKEEKPMDSDKAKDHVRRILSFSEDVGKCNFLLGQHENQLVFRFTAKKVGKSGEAKTEEFTFFSPLKDGKPCNVVISYKNQKLRFWVDREEKSVPEPFFAPEKFSWKNQNYQLIIGNEAGQKTSVKDYMWTGKLHSFSIRNKGVTLPKPDIECMKFLLENKLIKETPMSSVSFDQNTVFVSAPPSAAAPSTTTPQESSSDAASEEVNETKESSSNSPKTEPLEMQPEKKITIKEFAFPYPASFPVPRYGQRGNEIETEGVVLDQMRLAIAEDGTYRVDFQARTTMRADINLQLLVKLEGNHWYPITLPRQTILPENYQNFTTGSANSPQIQPVSIQGYAPVFVARSSKITDIRRRGNAVFGTRPPLTTQYHKTNCCDQKPDCSPAASTPKESSCTKQPESK